MRFDQPLGRCLAAAVEQSALTYDDIDLGSSTAEAGAGGPIYARFLSSGQCTVQNISATNTGSVVIGQTYGPLKEGPYNGTFTFVPGPNLGSPRAIDFTLNLQAPPAGTKRTYLIQPMNYDTTVHRCLFNVKDGRTALSSAGPRGHVTSRGHFDLATFDTTTALNRRYVRTYRPPSSS